MISKLTYVGDLRTEAMHLGSGNSIVTDAPKDNEGKGEAFSPTDLVATALASCMMTIMGIVARRDVMNIDGLTAEVDKIMSQRPRTIGEIKVRLIFQNPLNEIEREKLERAASTCPVSGSLHDDLKETIEFVYE